MAKLLLIIQQTACKIPFTVLETANSRNVKIRIIKLWHKRVLIPHSLAKYDGLIFLDGISQMDNDSQTLSYAQKAIIKSLDEDRPFLGIGYGQQILADHFGAATASNYMPSTGFTCGFLTKKGREHPIFKNLPNNFLLFNWHKKTILPPMPSNINVLASSKECQFEAIGITGRPHIIGLQFINNAATVKEIKKHAKSEEISEVMNEAARLSPIATSHFATIFDNFINMI